MGIDMTTRTSRRALGACLTLSAAALFGGLDAAYAQESVELSGDRVAVYNIAGDVEIVAGSGSEVRVQVMRGGDDAAELRLETGAIDGRETLRIIYPADEVVYSGMGNWSKTQLRVRDDGTWGSGRRGNEVEVKGRGGGLEAWADLRIEVPAGTDLEMYLAVGEISARDIAGDLSLDTHSGDVTAFGVRGDLMVDTGSGSVEVGDIEGSVNVDTGSGSIEVNDARGQELELDTGSGSVEGRDLQFSSVNVDTGSGSVELVSLGAAEVLVDTGSGSVDLDMTTDVDAMEIDTGSGRVTLRVPEEFGAQVEMDTGSGGIDLDVGIEARTVRRNYVAGTIGDGRGRVTVDTGSGGIRLMRH